VLRAGAHLRDGREGANCDRQRALAQRPKRLCLRLSGGDFQRAVTNVPGNVTLTGSPSGDSPTLLLIASGPMAQSLTRCRPRCHHVGYHSTLTGLEFGETYTLTLNSAIVNYGKDQNNNAIPSFSYAFAIHLQFTTSGPKNWVARPANMRSSRGRWLLVRWLMRASLRVLYQRFGNVRYLGPLESRG